MNQADSRIRDLADHPDVPKFVFGSEALTEFHRGRLDAKGVCINPSGYYVVIHSPTYRVLSCWNYGHTLPHSWDVPSPQAEATA